MTKMHFAPVAALAFVCALGCKTMAPEVRYYTLDMTPSGAVQPAVNIDIERLRPNDALARKEILIKKAPTRVEYYAVDQWAANLGDIVPEKLEAEFGPEQAGQPTVVISGDILAFEQVDVAKDAEAHIKLELSFRVAGMSRFAAPSEKKTFELSAPSEASSPGAVVLALSKGLEKLAVEVAAEAKRVADMQTAAPPGKP